MGWKGLFAGARPNSRDPSSLGLFAMSRRVLMMSMGAVPLGGVA